MKHYKPQPCSRPDLLDDRTRRARARALRARRDPHEPRCPDRAAPREEVNAEAHAGRLEAARIERYEAWVANHCRAS